MSGSRLTFLADQAWLMADAMVRAITRLAITRRLLLEWTTAAQTKATVGRYAAGFYRPMAGGVGLAIAIGAGVLVVRPGSALLAAPFVALWLAGSAHREHRQPAAGRQPRNRSCPPSTPRHFA